MARVLIAYDGSDPAEAAARAAGTLLPASEATVLFAYERPPSYERVLLAGATADDVAKDAIGQLTQDAHDHAMAMAEAGRATASEAGLTAAEPAVVPADGAVWPEIL